MHAIQPLPSATHSVEAFELPVGEPVDWTDGVPRSLRYGDIFHSASGGLAQARHVFLGGCNLPAAWARQPTWHILETGFGLGLTFLATWQAWRVDPQRPKQVVFESLEAHPVASADIRRAAADQPQLAALAEVLVAALATTTDWPRHDVAIAFEGGSVQLRVRLGDAAETARIPGPAVDSIYLDGFSPARNPQIWSPSIVRAIAARARPGARVATWTVAAAVRRSLSAAGFEVVKRHGFAPKRHCLAGQRSETPV